MTRKLLLVLVGGFCGTVTRYLLSRPLLALAAALPGAHAGFPYDTLLINLSGAFVIGLLFGAFEHGAPLSPDVRLTLGTGFLGAYTTFSSYMVGDVTLLEHGQAAAALIYLCGAMVGGVVCAWVGFTLVGALVEWQGRRRLALSDDAVPDTVLDGAWDDALQERHEEPLADVEGRAMTGSNGLTIIVAVGLAGALGAVARYLIVEWMARWRRQPFPLAILLINISGAFVLGFVTSAFAAPGLLDTRALLGVGFLGGYTTFSTLSYETFALARGGATFYAWLNVGGSLLAGVVAAALGLALGLRVG